MTSNEIVMRVVIENERALEALVRAVQSVQIAAADAPWSEELKEALESLRFVTDHLDCVPTESTMAWAAEDDLDDQDDMDEPTLGDGFIPPPAGGGFDPEQN